MPVASTNKEMQTPTSSKTGGRLKIALWAVMGAMATSVILYSEVPLLNKAEELTYLRTIPMLIIPHILGGVVALLSGPLQFSNRFRLRNPKFHRMLGRVYVGSVLIAAPLAMVLSGYRHDPRAVYFGAATTIQAGVWMITTAAAFLTARNRHFQQHREWMVRSYAVTFTFVGTRVLQPFPAWNRHSEALFAIEIILITFMAILSPDIALHWREITTRRV